MLVVDVTGHVAMQASRVSRLPAETKSRRDLRANCGLYSFDKSDVCTHALMVGKYSSEWFAWYNIH